MIRGHSIDNPVLLYLSGGPGQSSLPYPRVILSDLEQDFIVVGWDQRGAGKSYAALYPARFDARPGHFRHHRGCRLSSHTLS